MTATRSCAWWLFVDGVKVGQAGKETVTATTGAGFARGATREGNKGEEAVTWLAHGFPC